MTRPFDQSALDNAIAAYQAGQSIRESCAAFGIGKTTLHRHLQARGLFENRQRLATPPGLVDDFTNGATVQALALRHGVSRRAVERMLDDAGLATRSQSDALKNYWTTIAPADREAKVAAAHAAARGRVASTEELRLKAETRAGRIVSDYERIIGDDLISNDIGVEFGAPCGRYNIDIVARGSVAVEIFGGNWHASGYHRARFPERSRYVLDSAFSLLVIWVIKSQLEPARCSEHVIAMLEQASRNPTAPRQYRVIRGDGHLITAREDDGGEVPLIDAFGGCQYARA